MEKEYLTDVWSLETEDQEFASWDLNNIIDSAINGHRTSAINYLKRLWDNEKWSSIKSKLNTEGSVWYVWYLDGVNKHLYNLTK